MSLLDWLFRLIGATRPSPKPAEVPVSDQELSDHERLVRDFDLGVVDFDDELPDLIPQRDAMRRAWADRDFLAYRQAFEEARQGGQIAENGVPLYSLIKAWFLADFMDLPGDDGPAHEALLRHFEAFYERHPSPFSAATYADALRITAFACRGTACAPEVRSEQAAKFESYLAKAGAVLDRNPGPDDFAWRCVDARRAADASTLAEFKARFEAAWALDRYNIDLCRAHARMLMPRWLGERARDLEDFARRAADLTKDRFGMGFYALIQQANTEVGSHELDDTHCDPARAKKGFEDLLARFPAPSVMNRYADMLEWMGDNEALADLLASRFRTIVPQIWYGDTREEQLDYAFATLLEAREVLDARKDGAQTRP